MDIQYQDDAPEGKPLGAGVWSLCDMINYQLFGFCGLMSLLNQEERAMQTKANEVDLKKQLGDLVRIGAMSFSPTDRARLEPLLQFATKQCETLELEAARDRIARFTQFLRGQTLQFVDVLAEVRALREAIEDGIKLRHFYYYPKEKAQRLLRMKAEWLPVYAAFPSVQEDADAAEDCFALGHNRAAVYHAMMVLERGLESFARSLKVKYDRKTWQYVLDRAESAIVALARSKTKMTKVRAANLTFYSETAKEFTYFKDAWRNHTAHGRANYDENDARKVLTHVHDFMRRVSARLKEK